MARPSPSPPKRRVIAAVRLVKPIEDVGEQLCADAGSIVGNGHFGGVVDVPQLHGDAPAGRRELHRIGQQIPDHLLQAGRVTGDGADARR